MTKLLEQAFDAARQLSPERQDEIARAILTLIAGEKASPEQIDPARLSDVLEGLAHARRRQFANEADVEAAFLRFDA
jgi:DNA-binding transcriptional regulator YdaS (Cro superfamily)